MVAGYYQHSSAGQRHEQIGMVGILKLPFRILD